MHFRINRLLIVIAVMLFFCIFGCDKHDHEAATKLSFKSASTYEYLQSLDGKKVQINGYMATSSPVDGSFIFLMNLPYQSCPFCVPNTSLLSNTIEAYPKKNKKFSFTSNAIKVIGTLKVSPSKDEPFKDDYGYEFNFKIVDAEFSLLSGEELSENVKLYQELSNSNVINDLYKMYDYLSFCCTWPTYFVNSYKDSTGKLINGYYLYASDAVNLIKNDNGQYHYGYVDGYFDSLINRIKKVSNDKFDDLITNVEAAKTLAEYAVSELEKGNYSYEYKYVEKFNTEDYIYKLNDSTLASKYNNLYYEFSDWLGNFEM